MTSNFYVIQNEIFRRDGSTRKGKKQDVLVTARGGILPGVTRHLILRLARNSGLPIKYSAPRIAETFTEAFISSSSRGIVPVVSIDGRRVGEGDVGAWTRQLMDAYEVHVKKYSEIIMPFR
jgi:branched-subunit amino acid aminotransferase/4-amino-4-deoxychorismate lyase